MKNIIIAGPSRAGKSTLARRLNEELGCFAIGIDPLVAAFHGAYPQLGIRLNGDRRRTTDHIAPFLGHLLGVLSAQQGTAHALNLRSHAVPGNRFALEGGYVNFDIILPILNAYGIERLSDRFVPIGLVQNQKTADAFFRDFRKHDTPDDWTYPLNDADLREVSQEAVSFSRSMTEHLTKYGFALYDTSTDRARVFDRIIEEIGAEAAT